MLGVINKLAGLVPPLVYAAAVLGLALGLAVQTARLSGALQDAATLQAGLTLCTRVNQQNDAAIGALKRANGACLDGRRIDATRYSNAAAAWSETEKRLLLQRAYLKKERVLIYETSEACKNLGAISITNTCPDLADSLRDHYRSYNRN